MDPENGKNLPRDAEARRGGKKLRVRGHIALFYRTQYWERSEAPARRPPSKLLQRARVFRGHFFLRRTPREMNF